MGGRIPAGVAGDNRARQLRRRCTHEGAELIELRLAREVPRMADPYIDQFETLIYGKFAREQMAEVCVGKIKELDKMVHFAIATQEAADKAKVEKVDVAPDVAGQRLAWLDVYNANKLLIRGCWRMRGRRSCCR